MKEVEPVKEDCGILVGRFQVHELHQAHLDLINHVCNLHEKVIIFLGLSPVKTTTNNPLDFEARKQMILEKFPKANVLYIKDTSDDAFWSMELDSKIKDIVGPNQTVVLYGSRDSFISHYSGKYQTKELLQEVYISGSEIRKSIGKKVKSSADFRAGVIWAVYNQYPKVYTTVDIAIIARDSNGNPARLLLARKPAETLYRFIGGFAEPNSESFELDAKREVLEEAGDIEIDNLEYVCSMKIDDYRYRNEKDKIKTIFYKCDYIFGTPKASDDVCEIKWFDLNDVEAIHDRVVKEHQTLLATLMDGLLVKKVKKS